MSGNKVIQKGSAFDSATNRRGTWQLCTIIEVYPGGYSCDVKTHNGRTVRGLPWPGLRLDPATTSGEFIVPKRGEVYALHNEFGVEYLAHQVPQPVLAPASMLAGEHRIQYNAASFGGLDPVYSKVTPTRSYRGSMPPDVAPGDWARVGTKGNLVAVLDGGVTILKASELAQVVASAAGDLLHLVGRNVDIMSDFGSLQFRNDDGRVSMSLRGGSQQLTESSPSEEKFTLHLDLGHKGDVARFKITNQVGQVVAQVHYKPDGSLETLSSGELKEVSGKSHTIVRQDADTEVHGNASTTVDGVLLETAGYKEVHASGGHHIVSGSDASMSAGRDLTLAAGSTRTDTVSGPGLPVVGGTAYKTVVTNGSWVVDIGDPAAGDLGVAMPGFYMSSAWDVQMTSKSGSFIFKTSIPNSIQLGGQAPVWHAVRGEVLEQILDILKKLDGGHFHVSAAPGQPTGPSMTEAGPVAAGVELMLLDNLVGELKSTMVTMGG